MQSAEVEQVAVAPPHSSDPQSIPVGHWAPLLQDSPRVRDRWAVQIELTQLSASKVAILERMYPWRHISVIAQLTAGRTTSRSRTCCPCSATNTRSAYFVRVITRIAIRSTDALSTRFQGSTCAALALETCGTLRSQHTCGPFSSTDAVGRK